MILTFAQSKEKVQTWCIVIPFSYEEATFCYITKLIFLNYCTFTTMQVWVLDVGGGGRNCLLLAAESKQHKLGALLFHTFIDVYCHLTPVATHNFTVVSGGGGGAP
jgi:hypothetical protein